MGKWGWLIGFGVAAALFAMFYKGSKGFAIFSADKSTIKSIPNVGGQKSATTLPPTIIGKAEV